MEKNEIAFKNVCEIIEAAAKKHQAKAAFSFKENKRLQTRTFEQTYQDIQNAAGWLQENQWIGKKAALVGAMDYDWAVCFMALLYTGSAVIPMNYTQNIEELQEDLDYLEPDVLLYGKLDPIQTQWAKNTLRVKSAAIYEAREWPKGEAKLDFSSTPSKQLACVLFTTGSMGKKKAVMLSQENMAAICDGAAFAINAKKHTKEIAPVPNFHLMKIASIISMYSMGIEQYISSNSKRILKDIQEQKPSVVQTVPLIMEAIRSLLEEGSGAEASATKMQEFDKNLRTFSVGGSFSNSETIAFFERLGINVIAGYGMTEAGVISNIREGRKKPGSVGEIPPGTEVRIADGEIEVRGRNVMLGYYKDPEATKELFDNGWLKTGDLGYVDEEGYLFLTGRKKNLIILDNGENVSPEELEEKLEKCPYIREVLVKEKNGHLHAEVFADTETERPPEELKEAINDFIQDMNRKNVMCKRIVSWSLRDTPFEKINSLKIKRS